MKNYKQAQQTEQKRYDMATKENRKQNLIAQRNLESLMSSMDGTFSIIAYMTDSLFGEVMPMLHFFKNRLKYVMRENDWTMAVNIRENMPFRDVLSAMSESKGKPHIIDAKTWNKAFMRPRTFRRLPDGTDEFFLSEHLHGSLPLTIYIQRGKSLNLDSPSNMGVHHRTRIETGLMFVVVTDYVSRDDVIHLFHEKYPDKFLG